MIKLQLVLLLFSINVSAFSTDFLLGVVVGDSYSNSSRQVREVVKEKNVYVSNNSYACFVNLKDLNNEDLVINPSYIVSIKEWSRKKCLTFEKSIICALNNIDGTCMIPSKETEETCIKYENESILSFELFDERLIDVKENLDSFRMKIKKTCY